MKARIVYLLLTYKQEAFVAEAVASALAQDIDDLEIFISDDASPDNTFDVIRDAVASYAGRKHVTISRNAHRLGSVDHLVAAMDKIGDAFVVAAHGDDVAAPHRARTLIDLWRREKVAMVSSAATWIGDGAELQKDARDVSRRVPAADIISKSWSRELLGATLAFDSTLFTAFPRLSSDSLACGLDHVLPLRAAASRGLFFCAEPLIAYRRHAGNMSNAITDRSSDNVVLDEGLLAYEIAIRAVQRQDLLAHAKQGRFDFRRWSLLRLLDKRIASDIAAWSRTRATLKRRGLSQVWLTAAEAGRRKTMIAASF